MLKTFYVQLNDTDIITDIIEYPYQGYQEVQLNTPLPVGVMSRCYRLMGDSVVYIPELDGSIINGKINNLELDNTTMKNEQTTQNTDIKDNMFACVELCDMVLGIIDGLNQVPQVQALNITTEGVERGMAKIYAKLVIEGDITIDSVPARYKAEVERLLQIMDK